MRVQGEKTDLTRFPYRLIHNKFSCPNGERWYFRILTDSPDRFVLLKSCK
jgi:hypothetical protein